MARRPSQLQHGAASISEKEVSQDGWVRCPNAATTPLELLKPFDYSLPEPNDKIPDGNASCVAFMNDLVRALQMMICEWNVFKRQLMCVPGSVLGVWCLLSYQPLGQHLQHSSMLHGSRTRMEAAHHEHSKVAGLVQGSPYAQTFTGRT